MEKSTNFNFSDIGTDLMVVLKTYWEKFLFLLPNILLAILLLFIFLWLASKVRNFLKNRLSSKSHDQITAHYIALMSRWVVVVIGLLLILHTLGLTAVAGGLLASAGLSALVIGFAFKDIAENFLGGLILAFNRPFELQDTVSINDMTGKVIALNIRTTHIRTFDSKDVFIPNGTILNSSITNLTRNGRIRMDFVVGIDYNNNIQEAIDLIEETALGVEGILRSEPPYATVDELATNSVNIKVFFWAETDDFKKGVVLLKGNIMQQVTQALLKNGFGLPANIQELKLYDYQKNIPVQIVGAAAEKE
jgi:small conductance mechanosensitive channel